MRSSGTIIKGKNGGWIVGMMAFYTGVPVKSQFEWDMLLKLDSINEQNILEECCYLSV